MWDLFPFAKGNVYHPDFNGSFSLKSVLPAFFPDLTCKEMEVGNGEEAGHAWEKMLQSNTVSEEWARPHAERNE